VSVETAACVGATQADISQHIKGSTTHRTKVAIGAELEASPDAKLCCMRDCEAA
jgi:hypothetical protein